jgi:formylglycine-generating enzyme required for sulfatase activity
VDACRNELPDGEKSIDADYLPKPARGTAALFSCDSGQKSHESARLGKGHGVFFHFVLQGLRGKARNEDGTVTWQDLVAYVQREVPRAVPRVIREGAQQSPELLGRITNAPVLVRPDAELLPAKEVTNALGMKLRLIPSGEFRMGSPEDEEGRSREEHPHEVRITRPFYMGIYPVTQAEYEKVIGKNPSWYSPTGGGKGYVKGLDTPRFPVEVVSWRDAVKFCEELSALPAERKAGRVYRLPSEAEWEYACRAGTKSPFAFGRSLSSRQANFHGSYPYGGAPGGLTWPGRRGWAVTSRTPGACTTCTPTSGSGAPTATTRTTTRRVRKTIRKGRRAGSAGCCAAARG